MVSLSLRSLAAPVLLVCAACSGSSSVSIPSAGDDTTPPSTHDAALPTYGDTIGDASAPNDHDASVPSDHDAALPVDASVAPPDATLPPADAGHVVDAGKTVDANVPDTAGPALIRCGGGQFNEVM